MQTYCQDKERNVRIQNLEVIHTKHGRIFEGGENVNIGFSFLYCSKFTGNLRFQQKAHEFSVDFII